MISCQFSPSSVQTKAQVANGHEEKDRTQVRKQVDLELKGLVLNLVAPEVLRVGRRTSAGQRENGESHENRMCLPRLSLLYPNAVRHNIKRLVPCHRLRLSRAQTPLRVYLAAGGNARDPPE